jgi:hypothetical protein
VFYEQDVTSGNPVMTGTRTDDELLRIVGPDRDRHPPDQVAQAEAELKKRPQASDVEAADRVKTAGRVCVVLGLACVAVPLLVLTSDGPGFEGETLFSATAFLQVIAGILLAAGGLGLRRGRLWGVRLIVVVLWAALAWVAVFAVYSIVRVAAEMPAAISVVLGAFIFLIAAFWAFLMRRAFRFFRSAGVRRHVGDLA